ncbi:MAG TPA: hypothetical protein VHD62_18220 [Opitutaceae bacterium]|nr:hypothetical protein [Opitutaceae bacterium]
MIIDSPPAHAIANFSRVTKLCVFGGMTIFSYVGWAVGDSLFGFGFFGSFILSGVASMVGVYAGWKLAQKLQ